MKKKLKIDKIENLIIVRAIRNGLVNMIPILTIGAFALILQTIPIVAYQTFIKTFLNGFIFKVLEIIYSGTFGVLSLHMVFSISISYMRIKANNSVSIADANFTSLACFFILTGAYLSNFGITMLGPKSMFLAILTGLGASALFSKLSIYFVEKKITLIKYLEDIIFDFIKIDGSLVKGVATNQNCREIISSIARLATRLNMIIISEYVGTDEEREELHKIGCDNYQSYLYSAAVFLDEE